MFWIKNEGFVPLEDVQPQLGICNFVFYPTPMKMDFSKSPCTPQKSIATFVTFKPWYRKSLGIDGKYNIAPQEAFYPKKPSPFGYADISIRVQYRPWGLWFFRSAEFRFTTRQIGDGKLYWFEH
jgi:hypothetical protein